MIFCVIVLCIRLFILHGVERNANGHEVAFFKWSPGNLFISCDYLLWIQLENSKCICHYTILFGAIYRHDFNFLWMTIDNSKSSLNRIWNMIRFLLNQNWNCSRHSSCCFKYIWTVPKHNLLCKNKIFILCTLLYNKYSSNFFSGVYFPNSECFAWWRWIVFAEWFTGEKR